MLSPYLADFGHVSTKALGVAHNGIVDDYDAAQAAVEVAKSLGKTLLWSTGRARVSRPVVLNNVRIAVEDEKSAIENDTATGVYNLRAPFLIGNWHPWFIGQRQLVASGGNFANLADLKAASTTGLTNGQVRSVTGLGYYTWNATSTASDDSDGEGTVVKPNDKDPIDSGRWLAPWTGLYSTLHLATAAIGEEDTSVDLGDHEVAARFLVGSIYPIMAKEMQVQTSAGIQLRVPRDQSYVKVAEIEGATVHFERPIGFSTSTGVYLVHIAPGAIDQHGLPIYIAENVVLPTGLKVYGFNAVGSNCAAMYGCRIGVLGGHVVTPIMANGLTDTVIEGFRGKWTGARLVEVKYGNHNSFIGPIVANNPTDGSLPYGAGPMFNIGEGCRDLVCEGFQVDAPLWNQGQLFAMQPGTRSVFRNGRVFAPASVFDPVLFYVDPMRSVIGCGIENVDIVHRSTAHVVFQGADDANPFEPLGCFFRNNRMRSTVVATDAIIMLGGQNCIVTGNDFDAGKIFLTGDTTGCLIEGNFTDTSAVEGPAIAANIVRVNFKRTSGGELKPFGDLEGFVRATGSRVATSGVGIELHWLVTLGLITCINRDTGTCQALTMTASDFTFNTNAGARLRLTDDALCPQSSGLLDLGTSSQPFGEAHFTLFTNAANDTAAGTAGVAIGQLYWNGTSVVQRRS